jgi:hypothetical protein
MELEQMNILDIKKYFTKNSQVNFLNDFTLQDVEDAKKHIYLKSRGGEGFKGCLDKAAEKLAKDKFFAGIKEDQGVAVKNTVRDVLNANYKNTITRMIMVDSQFKTQLHEEDSNFLVHLSEKVVNAVSLELVHFQIPYTFYNIEARQGNNHFIVTTMNGDTPTPYTVTLPDGHYPDLDTLKGRLVIELAKLATEDARIAFTVSVNALSGLLTIQNTGSVECIFSFLTNQSKINHCLGWHLGFRKYQGTTLANRYISLDYVVPIGAKIEGNAVATVPHTKYFVVVVDDFNNNQTADTMIQNNIKPENTKPTSYFTQDPHLDKITPDNLSSYLTAVPNRTLTKNQLYTISQQNMEKLHLGLQNTRLEVHAPNQVLATIPFEECKSTWGSAVFTDKNKYIREYHSPTNIDRLQVKIFDDKGFLVNLNGNSWCMTLITNNLYKY